MNPRPLFFLVTPADFRRSILWAKTQPNLGVQIREKVMKARALKSTQQ